MILKCVDEFPHWSGDNTDTDNEEKIPHHDESLNEYF